MNPFICPQNVFIATFPQDMRAGCERLASIVITRMQKDPMDGSLYVFVSRNARQVRMIRFEDECWAMYTIKRCEGTFCWKKESGKEVLQINRTELIWMLEGLTDEVKKSVKPLIPHRIL